MTLHRDWCLEDIIPAPKRPQKLPIVLSPEEVLSIGIFTGPERNQQRIGATDLARALSRCVAAISRTAHVVSVEMQLVITTSDGGCFAAGLFFFFGVHPHLG